MGKYDPLNRYFLDLPPDQREVELAFTDVERIIGDRLPPTAHQYKGLWCNAMSHGAPWLTAGWRATEPDLVAGTVRFFRSEGIPTDTVPLTRRPKASYRRLRRFFESLPVDRTQLVMSFDDLERVMDRPLPSTAKTERSWWGNTNTRSQTKEWVAAGWRVDQVYLTAGLIVFRRPGSDPLQAVRRLVRVLLDPSYYADLPGAKQLAYWIRLCKLVGWYFEGTVLYERAGTRLEGLSEAEVEAVYEDYQICKRELTRYE